MSEETKTISFESIITANQDVLKIIDKAKKVCSSDISILLSGENGTGKNLFAQAIHNYSGKEEGKFVKVNCTALSEVQLQSELFGQGDTAGKMSKAQGGTLFLDKIGDLSVDAQNLIIRVLDEGGCRLIASSSEDLGERVKAGDFREDLYYRLNEIGLELPPLRSRREDIALLIQYFIGNFNKQFGKKVECVSNVALSYLLNYDWLGNIRELRNIIKTAVALSERDILWLEDVPLKITLTNETLINENDTASFSLKHAEKEHILRVLNMCRWNKSKASKILEISRPRLDRKIAEFKLKKPS